MPELPEIVILCRQMRERIVGKKIDNVIVRQPKNLNMTVTDFVNKISGRTIEAVDTRGKWLLLKLSGHALLLINLGMGGDLLYFLDPRKATRQYKFKLQFLDESGFTVNFLWFGYIHFVVEETLKDHKMVGDLGVSPLDADFTFEYLRRVSRGKRRRVKAMLLDQKQLAGIGNVYVQDILFKAGLHPNRKLNAISDRELEKLHRSIKEVLFRSIEKKGLAYERDFYGLPGGFFGDDFLVGYKRGKPCPVCSTRIEKIKIGNTASYICPECQPLNG